jgi:DNA-binding MarR family transcriptional regulator
MVEPYTQSLLLYAYQASAAKLIRTLHRHGHDAIRPKHGAVFANIDRAGTRATALAARAGIGKASMGELIDDLERLGYVERRPDPTDRRAKLVVPTQIAIDVTTLVHRFNRRLEASYKRLLGADDYDALRRSLRAMAPVGDMQPRIR